MSYIHGNTLNAVEKKVKALTVEDWDHKAQDLKEVNAKLEVFRKDGLLSVSAETEHAQNFIDYYGEFRGGLPFISDELKEIAAEHGAHWQWINPGEIGLIKN